MTRPQDRLDATLNRRVLIGRAAGLASAAGLATGGSLLGGRRVLALQDSPVTGGELIQSSGGEEPDTLDPHLTGYQNTASMAVQFLDSLIREDGNYQFHPNLAERWEISEDATTYTFYLKKGVVFHDGTPFNADAVKVNFDRIVDPATLSRMAAQYLGPYEGTEVVDEATVRVHFSKPFANFLDGAARSVLGFLSPAALQEYGTEIGRRPVGTGYFKFKEWEPSKHILFERNDQYAWGSPAFAHTGPAYLDSLRTVILADAATSLAAFDGGEIQLAPLPAQDVPKYTDDPNATILKRVYAGFPRSVFMNVEKPPTDDIRVRQACIYATNQQAIIQISLGGLVSPAYGPLASTTPGYDPMVQSMYSYDPEKAKQLLDEAGWVMGDGDFREKDGQRLTLTTIVNQGWDPYTIPLQAMMKDVGIDMQIQTLSSAARVEANARGDGNLAPLGADSSDPRILEITFRSSSIETGWAWSRFRNADLDALLDSAAGEADPATRAATYSQIQKVIMENALIIPLVENTYFTVFRPNVRGIVLDAQGYPWHYDTWLAQ